MEHILNLIEVDDSSNSKIKVSITESTMMQIVHRSMDKAYREVKCRNGILERLNEISKFYELAVMQLEGCLKFVKQETTCNYDLKTSQELLLEDLTEIKDRLQGRLKEVESAISDKDKELSERLGKELKLRKALEISEKKIVLLSTNLEEQRKTEIGSPSSIETGDREDEFCELKNTVDKQVWNIQQQLEPNYGIQDEERKWIIDNKKIEQMGSDIGILKETLDLAFSKMQNALFLSELGPIEHQWMWNIERSISAIVIRDSLKGLRDEVKKRELQATFGLREHLSDVIREINRLHHELRSINISNPDEAQVKISKSKGFPIGKCFSANNLRKSSSSIKLRGEADSDDDRGSFVAKMIKNPDEAAQVRSSKPKDIPSRKSSTIKLRENEEGSENDQGSLVAKMIKNHESIIRRKSEELELVTRELFREKAIPPPRKEKESVDLKRRFQELMVKLESLINLIPGVGDVSGDNRYDYELQKPPEVRPSMDDRTDIEKPGVHSMDEIWAKVNKTSVSKATNKDPSSEIKLLKQEIEDSDLQNRLLEETYLTIIPSLVDEFHVEMLNDHIHCLIKEGMYENFITEIETEWKEKMESEKYDTVSAKAVVPALESAHNSIVTNYQPCCLEDKTFRGFDHPEGMTPLLSSENTSLVESTNPDCFFRALWHEIYTFLLQKILGEWNENIETFKSISRLGPELCFIVYGDQIIRDTMITSNSALNELREMKADENSNRDFVSNDRYFETAAMSVKDQTFSENASLEESTDLDYDFRALWHEICAFLLQEILGEWNENIETFKFISCLGQELCFIVYGEIVRDAINISNSALIKLQEIKVDKSSNHDFEFDDKFFETAAMSIKDDVLKVLLADMIQELQMKMYAFSLESLIKEDILQFVIVEAVKQGCILEEADDNMNREQSPISPAISVDNLRHVLDRLVKFFEEEKTLIQTAYSETKQRKMHLQHGASRFDEFDRNEHCPGFFTYGQNSTNSEEIKHEKVLLQLDYGKTLLSELGSHLGIQVNNADPLIPTKYCRKPSIDESLETFIQDLSQTLDSFEFESFTSLGRHALRLNKMKGELDLVAQINFSLIKKESLYRNAFIRRCENLQMAEAEVDLLGDQVEKLMELLKKIYVKLHQHSPVLHHYFEVSEVLKLIEKEIGR